jgi:hypothetical protein
VLNKHTVGKALPNNISIKNNTHMQNGGEIARSIYRSGYGLLDDRGEIPCGAIMEFLLFIPAFRPGSGAHPASYPMGTRGYFPGGKAAGV